ncbi:hypothetical protein GA0116948_104210 [Chitinophaga costaii]|uniref:Uncharacterized protein n=1 Tax=Chitinophaga costaii TaxID=1335309 RepID=A0A1C4CN69_9BACT|nr:hypothetical protein GA0116948_104210 [Chitinophaga costaii]
MTSQDILLLARKIIVGILLVVGPLLVFFIALRLLQHFL